MSIRIQKHLSQTGVLSRRKAEEFLKKGWILINGTPVTTPGTRFNPETDTLTFSPEAQKAMHAYTLLALHKPKGIVTNCKQHDEREIIDLLPKQYQHLHAIGRLDKASEGLILLTDNGAIANYFLNTDTPHTRVYRVVAAHPLSKEHVRQLESGVDIGHYITKPCRIHQRSARHIDIELTEGKNRQIRRMLEAVCNRVHRLTRVQFGDILLGDLKPGNYRILTDYAIPVQNKQQ
jgi:pseudouridine synthase